MCEGRVSDEQLPRHRARGVYALVIQMARAQLLSVGRLGPQLMPVGVYVYVGSAMGASSQNLHGRIQRHLSGAKRTHWHIDAILAAPNVAVRSVVYAEASRRLECQLAHKLLSNPSSTVPVQGLGASDCREGCRSHLLLFPQLHVEGVEQAVSAAFKALELSPTIIRA